ncbi:hypothetical protein ACFXPS_43755 [Nocardia sp. NPDC059091]|uniref:hypothetical protein n=1 Tax=unclassified Nocardia TaxID=2637762 RepID=UPI0036A79F24
MMFQPWLKASGWDGKATVDAFGRMKRTTSHLNLWSRAAPPGMRVSGIWAILATVLIFIVVCAAIQVMLNNSQIARVITAFGTIAIAGLVLYMVINLDDNIPKIQGSLGMGNDLGPQLGLVLGALRHTGSYPWPGEPSNLSVAGLTNWAFAATAVAFGSAIIAVTLSWRDILPVINAVVGKLA